MTDRVHKNADGTQTFDLSYPIPGGEGGQPRRNVTISIPTYKTYRLWQAKADRVKTEDHPDEPGVMYGAKGSPLRPVELARLGAGEVDLVMDMCGLSPVEVDGMALIDYQAVAELAGAPFFEVLGVSQSSPEAEPPISHTPSDSSLPS